MNSFKTKDTLKSVEKIITDKNQLEKSLSALEQQALAQQAISISKNYETINDIQFIAQKVEVANMDAIKKLANDIKGNLQNGFVILTAIANEKPLVAIAIDEVLAKAKDLNAGNIIKAKVAPLIKGGGGGSPQLASAGGSDSSNLEKVLDEVKTIIQ